MNERIKELAKNDLIRSEYTEFGSQECHYYQFDPDELEKFAKLIIQECIQILRDNTPVIDEHDSVEDWNRGYIRAMVDCEHHIKEHFGVEE